MVDEKSRVTYAVARIEDPYRMVSDSPAGEALPMGTFVAADIEGTRVQNTVRVPRSALRANNQLMVIDEKNKLEMRRVEILRADAKWAYIDHGVVAADAAASVAADGSVGTGTAAAAVCAASSVIGMCNGGTSIVTCNTGSAAAAVSVAGADSNVPA